MTELINPTDLPADASKSLESSEIPPGASMLRHVRGRGTEWYCRGCLSFVDPTWIRVAETIYPACLECFYTELIESKGDVDAAVEENTNVVAEAESIPAASGDASNLPVA